MVLKKYPALSGSIILLSLIVWVLFTGTVFPQTSENYTIKKWEINGGGGSSASSLYMVQGACGQPSAGGIMASTNYGIAAGFWGERGIGTAIEDNGESYPDLPNTFHLYQNYPNPFNPVTCIEFDLPGKAEVTLTVFDLRGKLINRLVQGNQVAGNHTVIWRGSDVNGNTVSSGMYFYRIIVRSLGSGSGTIVKVKKMIFMK